jgi:hypothetical protein
VRARTRAKNQVHAVLQRNLLSRPPVTDLFGRKGRAWLAEQVVGLPLDERLSVDAGVRQVDFLAGEIEQLDRIVGADALSDPDALRLMTLPGVSVGTAIALLAAIGDIRRFATPRQLVAYLGLDPRVRQSGSEPAKHGRISKQGAAEVRSLLVEAGWQTTRTPGPLRAFHERIAERRGRKIATVATARKLVVIAWHLLSRGEEYAFGRPALYREKLRRIELLLGPPATRDAARPAVNCSRPLNGEPSARSPPSTSAPTNGWSPTGRRHGRPLPRRSNQSSSWARARHRGAHLKGPRGAKPRGRLRKPQRSALRFVSHPRPTSSFSPKGQTLQPN